ncbi:MAG: hypothetical protein ACOY31_02740 [Bacillota bacterium]
MAIFKDSNQLNQIMTELWELLLASPSGPKLLESGLVVKFTLSDPEAIFWATVDGLLYGPQDLKPDVELILSGDTAHKFFLKQVSLPVALAKRQIKSKGALDKVMKLLPLLGPNYENYPKLCQKYGLPTTR